MKNFVLRFSDQIKLILFFLLVILCTFALNAQTVRYVKQGGTGNGLSCTNASGNLQNMINASAGFDEVWVAAGSYFPNAYPNACSNCSSEL